MRSFRRPNIVIIYTDQQRFDTLGINGQTAVNTPNIDALAQRGARLENCYVQNPVCAPSRACFLSGQYCSTLKIGTNGIVFPENIPLLPELLKPYGYSTANIGKLHLDPHAGRDHRKPPKRYGFDVMIQSEEPGCYDDAYTKWVERISAEQLDGVRTSLPPAAAKNGRRSYSDLPRDTNEPYVFGADASLTHTAFVTDQVCSFISSQAADKPYMVIAGFYAPHPPLNPPREYIDRVDRSRLRLPVMGADEKLSPALSGMTEEKWLDTAQAYLAMTAQIDDCTGRIVDCINRRGDADDTVIVFTSDHGEYLGDHGRIQKWMPGHDCIIHVPCLISYPRVIKGGRICNALAEQIDVLPTLLDFAGVQTPPYICGRTLEGLLRGDTDIHRDNVLTELFSDHGERQTTVRTERFKYYCAEDGAELLYDLEKDPMELSNVVNDSEYAGRLSEMRLVMIRAIQRAAYNGIERMCEY